MSESPRRSQYVVSRYTGPDVAAVARIDGPDVRCGTCGTRLARLDASGPTVVPVDMNQPNSVAYTFFDGANERSARAESRAPRRVVFEAGWALAPDGSWHLSKAGRDRVKAGKAPKYAQGVLVRGQREQPGDVRPAFAPVVVECPRCGQRQRAEVATDH
jgi:hypothetical protein